MSTIIDGTSGITTPGLTNTGPTALTTPLPVASGGTNSTATPTSGGVGYGTGSAHAYTSAGTSGQVLTSAGAGAPVWATLSVPGSGGETSSGSITLTSSSAALQSVTTTGYGQTVTLPDATTLSKGVAIFAVYNAGAFPLIIRDSAGTDLGFVNPYGYVLCSLADNSTSAGNWDLLGRSIINRTANGEVTFASSLGTAALYGRSVTLDSNRTMLLASSSAAMHAVVYDASTRTFGTPVLVRNANVTDSFIAGLQTTDRVLVVSCNATTGMEAVILSVSGTTITVNTAATATLAGNINSSGFGAQGEHEIVTVGTSYIVGYTRATTVAAFRVLTVSGTTVTIGAEVATTGTGVVPTAYAVTASTALVLSQTASSTITGTVYTISGSTASAGSSVSITSTVTGFVSRQLGSRYAVICQQSASILAGNIISVSGTTPTNSNVTLTSGTTSNNSRLTHAVSATQLAVCTGNTTDTNLLANILTDNAGTAVAGTAVSIAGALNGQPYYVGGTSSEMWVYAPNANTVKVHYSIAASGNNPLVTARMATSPQTSSIMVPGANTLSYKGFGISETLLFNSSHATVCVSSITSSQEVFTGRNTYYIPAISSGASNNFVLVPESTSSIWSISAVAPLTSNPTRFVISRIKLVN